MLYFFHKKHKVVILGAGLAGLTAAYYLKRHHFDVTILEARDRIGGRVDTRIIDKAENLTVEMGGEWVGKTHKKMQTLCRELGLSLVTHRLKTHLLLNGKYYKPSEWHFSKSWQQKLHKLVKQFSSLTDSQINQLEDIDWWHYLVSNHIPRRDLEILDLLQSTDVGEDIRFESSYAMLEDLATGGGAELECYYRIVGGNWNLPKALLKKVGSNHLKLNHEVSSIHQADKKVIVKCKDGSTWKADYIISTLPTFPLTQISWSPSLPEDQYNAFCSLNYARIMKNAVLFNERFWKGEDFELATDSLSHYIYHSTQNQKGKKGVLTSYSTGDKAYVLSKMNDEEIKKEMTDTLKKPFGEVEHQVERIIRYYWADDPYTKGAYAVASKNDPSNLQDLLSNTFGRVFFAGEHTAKVNSGFMEGAVESGEFAAMSIVMNSKVNQ